jgi:hypothetical protein
MALASQVGKGSPQGEQGGLSVPQVQLEGPWRTGAAMGRPSADTPAGGEAGETRVGRRIKSTPWQKLCDWENPLQGAREAGGT